MSNGIGDTGSLLVVSSPVTILSCSGGNKRRLSIEPAGLSGGGDLPVELTREIMLELALPCSTDLYFGGR